MPELSQTAKRFGSRSRPHISASLKRNSAEFLKEHRQRVRNGNGEVSAKIAFGEAAAIHLRNLDDDMSIKPRTANIGDNALLRSSKAGRG